MNKIVYAINKKSKRQKNFVSYKILSLEILIISLSFILLSSNVLFISILCPLE